MNIIEIEGYKAVVVFDAETGLLRGEFLGLNGGADFYASSVADLTFEGKKSLKVFLDVCRERGIEPHKKHYSGNFMLRTTAEVHRAAAMKAQAEGLSLNQWADKVLRREALA